MVTPAKVLAPVDARRLTVRAGKGRQGTRDKVIVLLSFRAGMRACEIAGLDWRMVMTPSGRISTTVAISGRIAKNGRGRHVPVHPELKLALEVHHAHCGGPRFGPVVQSRRGSHLKPRSIVNWFRQVYDELGLTGCSSHSGRRTFITGAARAVHRAGGSLRDVQELAGHRALTTTERYIEGDRDAQHRLIKLL
ncbi:hypothetical protein GCM10023264_12140 [Sphingomonas daechungensis]|uniref:tyrosine-type recombinase/integrase n=1 Tax=Sphingomonas daechungensis TaxID=1176646 RepID=UPI0031E99F64